MSHNQDPLHTRIARWLEARTDDRIQVDESSLYPALCRLEKGVCWLPSGSGASWTGGRSTTA